MKPTIDNPKVFISYAWSNDDYQQKVVSLATDLERDGIDVIFDKWDLREGNDTYTFMEKTVNDTAVTNVIILLDPVYEKKANEKQGGVGTETQIISPEVYNNTKQEKFLPVIFQRKDDGGIPKPTYLKSLLHFDLSEESSYDSEYKRLVKRLYGVDIHKKPERGNMPNWVTNEVTISTKNLSKFQSLKFETNPKNQKDDLLRMLNDLKDRIIAYDQDQDKNALEFYIDLQQYRDEFLILLKYSHGITDMHKIISEFLDEIRGELENCRIIQYEIKQTLIHEMFIYIVAYFYKMKDYDALCYILGKTYFIQDKFSGVEDHSYIAFYTNNSRIDMIKCKNDDKKYHSGLAQHFIDSFNSELCNQKEFCFADELCYNYSMIADIEVAWYWFPITYVYDGEHYSVFKTFSKKLISKEWATTISEIFGFDKIDDLKRRLTDVKKSISESNNRYRYNMAFRAAPLIIDYIKLDDIATMN